MSGVVVDKVLDLLVQLAGRPVVHCLGREGAGFRLRCEIKRNTRRLRLGRARDPLGFGGYWLFGCHRGTPFRLCDGRMTDGRPCVARHTDARLRGGRGLWVDGVDAPVPQLSAAYVA